MPPVYSLRYLVLRPYKFSKVRRGVMDRGDAWDERGWRGQGQRTRNWYCMATTVTPTLCLKTLLPQLLRSPKTTCGRRMCTMSGVVGKQHGMCVP